MYNLYIYISYILLSVFLHKKMKKFSSLPLKSPTCEIQYMTLCKHARCTYLQVVELGTVGSSLQYRSCINGDVVGTITSIVFGLKCFLATDSHETGLLVFCVSIFTLVIALVSSLSRETITVSYKNCHNFKFQKNSYDIVFPCII